MQGGPTLYLADLEKNQLADPPAIYQVIYSGRGKMPGYGIDCAPKVTHPPLPVSHRLAGVGPSCARTSNTMSQKGREGGEKGVPGVQNVWRRGGGDPIGRGQQRWLGTAKMAGNGWGKHAHPEQIARVLPRRI